MEQHFATWICGGFLAQKFNRIPKQKELLEAQALLNAQALERTAAELVVKQTALEETTKQLDLKNDFIDALQLTLTDYANTITETDALLKLKILTKDDWTKFLGF
jgi:hypothetical protein